MAEYCSDYFRMVEDNDDSFRMWQGLVGPYYTPQLSNDGTLSFTNNGSLPNPDPVNLRGPQGAGIRIAGIVETAESLPASAAAGDIWLGGEVSPYEGYSYLNGEWIDLGPLTVGPAGPPGPQGDDYELTESDKQEIAEISEALLLAELDETPLGIRYGGTGARDVDGAKENLGIDDIETKLGTWPLGTDAQDVAGAINEMIGNIELQVDDIQKLKDDLAAEFNPYLTYAKGSYRAYGGDLYLCHTPVTTPGAWTGDTNWTAVTVGAEMKAVKDIEGDGQLSGFTATDLTGAANELKNTLNSLENRFSIVSTGSLHDITTSGVYYVTGAVTDKPTSTGGLYLVSAFNTEQLVGKYISFYNEEYNVSHSNNVWTYTPAFGYAATTVSGRTTSSGAIDVPLAYANNVYVNARITAGGPGFVIRRDAGYFTVFDNTGNPLGNTDVTFIAYFFT